MSTPPKQGEGDVDAEPGPIRTVGITPGQVETATTQPTE